MKSEADLVCPSAILFHGGGHVMLSRKTINPMQIGLLLRYGFLPVSFDFRLCPELNVLDGPMNDVCEALRWARVEMPTLAPTLAPGLEADGEKVVAVGFSSGGHLALTLGFTAAQRGLRPPEAILAFYCPTDYHDERECSFFHFFYFSPSSICRCSSHLENLDWRTPFNCELSLSSPDGGGAGRGGGLGGGGGGSERMCSRVTHTLHVPSCGDWSKSEFGEEGKVKVQ